MLPAQCAHESLHRLVEDEFGITVPAEDYDLMLSADGIVQVVGDLTE